MLDKVLKYKFVFSILLLVAFYVSGIIGIATNSQVIDFLSLTPLNLIVGLVLLIINHQKGSCKQWLVFSVIAIIGYLIEVAGVNTGLIFGQYEYGETLGYKLLGTPIIIAVNWLVLIYVAVYTFGAYIHNKYFLAFTAAAILVGLDFLIEPIAMAFDFWNWHENNIPLKNYIAWFIISFLFSFLLVQFKNESKNRFAPYLLVFQFIFFAFFNLYLTN